MVEPYSTRGNCGVFVVFEHDSPNDAKDRVAQNRTKKPTNFKVCDSAHSQMRRMIHVRPSEELQLALESRGYTYINRRLRETRLTGHMSNARFIRRLGHSKSRIWWNVMGRACGSMYQSTESKYPSIWVLRVVRQHPDRHSRSVANTSWVVGRSIPTRASDAVPGRNVAMQLRPASSPRASAWQASPRPKSYLVKSRQL